MKRTTGILLLTVAGLWYGILRGVNAVKVTLEKIRWGDIKADGIEFSLAVLIHNPLLVSVTIDNIVGDIYIMDIPCAKVNTPIQQTLAGRATSRVWIDFLLESRLLGEALWQNIQSGDVNNLVMRFAGYVTVKGVQIPIDRVFTLSELLER